MPRKPRYWKKFLAAQYTIGALGELAEVIEVDTNVFEVGRKKLMGRGRTSTPDVFNGVGSWNALAYRAPIPHQASRDRLFCSR